MSPVMVKLLASAALPASELPSVVSETRPCRAFRLVTLSVASPCAASAAAAMNAAAKTPTTNRFKANACLELIPMLPLPHASAALTHGGGPICRRQTALGPFLSSYPPRSCRFFPIDTNLNDVFGDPWEYGGAHGKVGELSPSRAHRLRPTIFALAFLEVRSAPPPRVAVFPKALHISLTMFCDGHTISRATVRLGRRR